MTYFYRAQHPGKKLTLPIENEVEQEDRNARQLHDRLMIRLSGGEDLIDGFEIVADELAELVASDGIAVYSAGRFIARGKAPSEAEFRKLSRFLNTAPTGQVFATDNLVSVYPDATGFGDRVAGLMAVPISRTPRDYIVFFRREIAKSVKWAGNPDKPVEMTGDGARLTPRKSFESWIELVRGTSAKWSQSELRTGEALRISLIEIVLKLTDEANELRRKAGDKQELLIAELNHRVRNILNLIQGLVSQSRSPGTDIASYTAVLDGRIQSLARAHDQLTRREWSPSSLRDLINVEVTAFLNGQQDRLKITGDAPMLAPEAFSTMALVVHELVTNSAKYGALTDKSGSVSVDVKIMDDGVLQIAWRERGGPPVKAPTRQGFGTTIIEKTIPYELKGTVETRYLLSGMEADIMIPSRYISGKEDRLPESGAPPAHPGKPATATLTGEALVVEDNMVIAMDTADILTGYGASNAHMASSVADALALINANPIDFALLDVNLGDQTSLPVAERLAVDGIPFILATGYGDAESVTTNYPPAEVVNKPFTTESLLEAVARALTREEGGRDDSR